MNDVIVQTYETIPRRATITEQITSEILAGFALVPHCRVVDTDHTQAVMYMTKHGEVPASIGQHVVVNADEAYPITADELIARYRLVEY